MTLVDFLLARIAEDEAAALTVLDWSEAPRERRLPWKTTPADGRIVAWGLTCVGAGVTPEVGAYFARHDPARVLAECKAKRWVIENHSRRFQASGELHDAQTLRLLALPYADHPDYSEEFRP